jgi:hypothetical protein
MQTISGNHAAIVEALIDKFDVTSVTVPEAGKTKDYIVTHLLKANRIDRQGPAFDGTHARFAVQIGSATYAGVHMPAGIDFPVDVVRAAFRASFAGRYRKLTAT